MRRTAWMVLGMCAGLLLAGCRGTKDGEGAAETGKPDVASEYQAQVDEIAAAVDAGQGSEQSEACRVLMAAIGGGPAETGSELGRNAAELCRGKVARAMYDKTIADVESRPNQDLPPFMECVPAQTALEDETTEVSVPGLAESRARARELCKEAWAD